MRTQISADDMQLRIRIRISLFRNKIRNDFNKFYRYLNNSWKPILWVQPLSHRLPKQQHCSEIIYTKNQDTTLTFKSMW